MSGLKERQRGVCPSEIGESFANEVLYIIGQVLSVRHGAIPSLSHVFSASQGSSVKYLAARKGFESWGVSPVAEESCTLYLGFVLYLRCVCGDAHRRYGAAVRVVCVALSTKKKVVGRVAI